VPNGQLIKEDLPVAQRFKGQSVAEQNSIDVAWKLLQLPKYKELRACLFQTDEEVQRFRQVIVNAVIATDIFDKDLKSLREDRWDKAFHQKSPECADAADVDANRRATIVIETLIQASDVSHCMQHWQIYQKWNKKLFQEMWAAYESGRAENDPSLGWYKGELWFFDNYVIPLSKKLKECGVFGVSCDEFLNDATDNRAEWAEKGEAIVQEWMHEHLGASSNSC